MSNSTSDARTSAPSSCDRDKSRSAFPFSFIDEKVWGPERSDLLKVTQLAAVTPKGIFLPPLLTVSRHPQKPNLSSGEYEQQPKTQGWQITMQPCMCRTHRTFTLTSPPPCFYSVSPSMICLSPISVAPIPTGHSRSEANASPTFSPPGIFSPPPLLLTLRLDLLH